MITLQPSVASKTALRLRRFELRQAWLGCSRLPSRRRCCWTSCQRHFAEHCSSREPSTFSFCSIWRDSSSGTYHLSSETCSGGHRRRLSCPFLFCGSSCGTCSLRSVPCLCEGTSGSHASFSWSGSRLALDSFRQPPRLLLAFLILMVTCRSSLD